MPTIRPRTEERFACFSQSLESKIQQNLMEERHSPVNLFLFGMPTIFCAGLMLLARPDSAQAQPGSERKPVPMPGATRLQPVRKAEDEVSVAPDDRRPFAFYRGGLRDTLFSAPMPPLPPRLRAVAVPITRPPVVPVVPINPFADWSYTGTIRSGEQVTALLENMQTKEGQYVRKGETFLGAQVSDINEQRILLRAAGKPISLAKSDNITIVPLDKNAPFLNSGQPGQPLPGQPGTTGMYGVPPPGSMPPTTQELIQQSVHYGKNGELDEIDRAFLNQKNMQP